jgi:hypothetical protein
MTKRTWTVIEDGGNVELLDESGLPVTDVFYLNWIYVLKERYEFKDTWVYMAPNVENHCFKIGITNNLLRRQGEIKTKMWHFVPCATHKARVFERALHFWLKPYSLGHEWYDANNWEQFNELTYIKNQDEMRMFLYSIVLGKVIHTTGDEKAKYFERVLKDMRYW